MKTFLKFYFGSALIAAVPPMAAVFFVLWVRSAVRARRSRQLYRMMTSAPRAGADAWDRTVGVTYP